MKLESLLEVITRSFRLNNGSSFEFKTMIHKKARFSGRPTYIKQVRNQTAFEFNLYAPIKRIINNIT